MLWHNEYSTKLDSFYFDQKTKTTKLLLKIRNKRAICRVSINDILKNEEILSNLHPIDLFTIGVLANTSISNPTAQKKNISTIIDDYLMVKISPLLEVISRNYTESNGKIVLKIKPLGKIITVTASELYKNRKLINALKYQDALSLGYSIDNSESFLQNTIVQQENNYDMKLCINNGILLSLIIISLFSVGRKLFMPLLSHQFFFDVEVLFLPFIFATLNFSIKKLTFSSGHKLIIAITLIIVGLLAYYALIVNTPYPSGKNTEAFNELYFSVIKYAPRFITCMVVAILFGLCFSKFILKISAELNSQLKFCALNLLCISVFFIASYLYCFLAKCNNYLVQSYFALILSVIIIHILITTFFRIYKFLSASNVINL